MLARTPEVAGFRVCQSCGLARSARLPAPCCSALLPVLPFTPWLSPSESQGVTSPGILCLSNCIQSLGENPFLFNVSSSQEDTPLPEILSRGTPSKLPLTSQRLDMLIPELSLKPFAIGCPMMDNKPPPNLVAFNKFSLLVILQSGLCSAG